MSDSAKKIIVNALNKVERKQIPVDQLLLWRNNPRLIELRDQEVDYDKLSLSQEEVQDILMNQHKTKELVDSILSSGWLDQELMMVAEYEKNNDGKMQYIVLEGNRRTTAIKHILEHERNISGVKDGYDIRNFEQEQLGSGISCLVTGKYKDLLKKGDIQAEVDRILNARHMFGQEEWKLHRKAFQTFNKYMDELAAAHSGVDPNSPESFFIDNNVVKQRSKIMCETPAKIKNYLYLYTLRNQISSKLISDYGIEFDNNKTSFIEEFLKKPSLKNRYQFDPIYGVMGDDDVLIEDMTPLELFISLIFRYERPDGSGENKPIITAASAGQSNLRDYGYVVDNDRTGNKNYIKMIEVGDGGGPDTRVISKIARAKWDAQSLQYKVGESFQEIARILDGINTKTIHEARSDAMEQDYKLIKEKFSLIDAALKQKSKF
jgi:hypothetical protein